MDAAKNFAKGTLSTGYDDAATSIVLISGDGARFPAVPFNAVWWNATDYPDPADDPNVEIIRVTARSTDTLTVTRGVETTFFTHELEGKTYKLTAPLTAKAINSEMLNVAKAGDNYEVTSEGNIAVEADGITLSGTNTVRVSAVTPGLVVDISGTSAGLGDVDENNSGAAFLADDSLGQCSLRGKVGTNQKVSASVVPTSVNGKIEVFDLAGNSIGFVCLYSSIT